MQTSLAKPSEVMQTCCHLLRLYKGMKPPLLAGHVYIQSSLGRRSRQGDWRCEWSLGDALVHPLRLPFCTQVSPIITGR